MLYLRVLEVKDRSNQVKRNQNFNQICTSARYNTIEELETKLIYSVTREVISIWNKISFTSWYSMSIL